MVAACAARPLRVAAAGALQIGMRATPAQVDGLASLLSGDVRFANLEGPLVNGAETGLAPDGARAGGPVRFAGPPGAAAWLRGKLDVVSLANNHALDQGV